MKISKGESGFTLIEIIVVIVILGIMAVVLTNAIVYGIQSYVFARNADQLSQKAQLAMARINRELTDVTAISVASADQIDYTLIQILPGCAVSTGCSYQYSIKRTGTQVTLERTTAPIVAAQILINGLNSSNGGNNFLSYFRSTGSTVWTTADGFKNIKADGSSNANYLGTIKVQFSLDFTGVNPLYYQGTINPRANGVLTAPQLN